MSLSHREELSAFIDGALGRSEAAFLLRRLQHDEELLGSYERFHLIGDCLRSQAGQTVIASDLAAGVRAALAAESAPGRPLPWRGGLQWVAGLFTATVVAAAAFWSVQPPRDSGAMVSAPQPSSEVQSSTVRVDDLRRQLPLLPVSARQSRPLAAGAREFAPQPDPEAWQQAPVAPLHYPSTHYIILVPRPSVGAEIEPRP